MNGSPALPFAIGERLNYRVRVNAAGSIGHGSMWIEGPVDVRGTLTYHLISDFEAKFAWIRAYSRSESWLDPQQMTALRFEKNENQPRAKARESVEIFPEKGSWKSTTAGTGASLTCAPLDELSFIYYVRTLDLSADSSMQSNRHYDARRNPVTIRVVRRQTLHIDKEVFETIVVEMHVRDAQRFKDEGVITLYLTDDARRIPVRIESPAPFVGTVIFTLESRSAY